MFDDLHRPLGRHITRPVPRRQRLTARRMLSLGVVLLVLGGSAATALLQPKLGRTDFFEQQAARERAEAGRIAAMAPAPAALQPLQPLKPSPKIETAELPRPGLPTITYPPGETGAAGRTITVRDPASLRQPLAAAALADDALMELSDAGPLPVRGPDGRRPFDVYSVPAASDAGTRIAVVVGGLGISQTGTQAAIRKLPSAVTLAFAPAGNSLGRWMRDARRGGHELLLQVPMEPFGYPGVTPGPHTVTADDALAGRFDDLKDSLGRMTNYVGVMNYMGARVSGDDAAIRGLLAEFGRRGLLYLDDASSARSRARDAARDTGTVFAASDVLIDGSQEPAEIRKQLETLERVARADGTAIGVASAFDVSVDAVAAWIREAEARGIKVVPISALAMDPENR